MLPAVVKLCCGISYPHLRSMAGLQRTAVAVIGREVSCMQRWGHIQLPEWMDHMRLHAEPQAEDGRPVPLKEEQLFYVQQGEAAMRKALDILENKEGWKTEIAEDNGDVICSKVMAGARQVFRLEAVLDASAEELYDILFVRVEEMHRWNPSIQHIKVLLHVGPGTVVTHEVSAETAGNLIGQRDFLSVRHSCKHKSCIHLGGAATQLESFPPQKGFVRAEDGPTCIIIEALADDARRSRFTWLLNMDVKGWLPKSIVNQALPRAQLDFTRHLRRRLLTGATLG
ncbi:steroidogenic acute regulatory protein, mitochondrial-like [Diretmus argenteus]